MKNRIQHKKKHPLTPLYIFSYLILTEDVWRIAFGVLFACILAPSVLATRQVEITGTILIYVMLICIGWWLSGYPAKKITRTLMAWIRKKSI